MILGVGIDIVENERIKRLYKRFGEKFVRRVLSSGEIEEFFSKTSESGKVEFLSGRWVAKESFWKACGIKFMFKPSTLKVSLSGDNFTFEIYSERIKRLLNEKGIIKILCSISHEKSYTVAIVILEGG